MPYLALDLDAKKKVPLVARACGVSPGDVLWGLAELWEHVWSTKSDVVVDVVVAGCFGSAIRLEVLVAFGFLEPQGGDYRVKGADRYLRVSEARRKGAAATNAKRAGSARLSVASERSSDAQATLPDRTTDALTPSIEHRTPNTDEKPSAKKPADPRHQPLVKALKDYAPDKCFLTEKSSGRDAAAVKELLALGEPIEVLQRWQRALRRDGFPTVRTLPELAKHWTHFATDTPAKPGAPIDPLTQGHRTEGPITATEVQL